MADAREQFISFHASSLSALISRDSSTLCHAHDKIFEASESVQYQYGCMIEPHNNKHTKERSNHLHWSMGSNATMIRTPSLAGVTATDLRWHTHRLVKGLKLGFLGFVRQLVASENYGRQRYSSSGIRSVDYLVNGSLIEGVSDERHRISLAIHLERESCKQK